MASKPFVGIRVLADENGYLKANTMEAPGSYGRATFDFVGKFGKGLERHNWWDVRAPDGSTCVLNPTVHTVTEHEDGTITVHPSIVTHTWHGWLVRGIWTSV